MEAWIISFFVVAFEVRGSLYFCDTFLERKETGRQGKFRFLIYYAVMYGMTLTDYWIGMLKLLPVISAFIVLNMLFYKVSVKQSVFFSVLNYGIISLVDYVVVALWWILLSSESMQAGVSYYITVLIAKILWLTVILLIGKKYKQRNGGIRISNMEWMQLSIIPGFTICALLCMFWNNPSEKNVQRIYFFLAVGLVAVNFIVINLIQDILRKEGQIRVGILAYQNQKNQLDAYQDMGDVYERQRRKMHDYKNQIATVQNLVQGGNIDKAVSLMGQLTESISVDLSAINTNHPVVNAVLNQKFYTAKEKQVAMIFQIGDVHEILLTEEEIVILLSNLLDNAITECEKVVKAGRDAVIHIKLVYEDGKVILSVKNPVLRKVEIVDNKVRVNSKKGHGIGLKNVETVVEKYDGSIAFDCDDKEFKAVVIL